MPRRPFRSFGATLASLSLTTLTMVAAACSTAPESDDAPSLSGSAAATAASTIVSQKDSRKCVDVGAWEHRDGARDGAGARAGKARDRDEHSRQLKAASSASRCWEPRPRTRRVSAMPISSASRTCGS